MTNQKILYYIALPLLLIGFLPVDALAVRRGTKSPVVRTAPAPTKPKITPPVTPPSAPAPVAKPVNVPPYDTWLAEFNRIQGAMNERDARYTFTVTGTATRNSDKGVCNAITNQETLVSRFLLSTGIPASIRGRLTLQRNANSPFPGQVQINSPFASGKGIVTRDLVDSPTAKLYAYQKFTKGELTESAAEEIYVEFRATIVGLQNLDDGTFSLKPSSYGLTDVQLTAYALAKAGDTTACALSETLGSASIVFSRETVASPGTNLATVITNPVIQIKTSAAPAQPVASQAQAPQTPAVPASVPARPRPARSVPAVPASTQLRTADQQVQRVPAPSRAEVSTSRGMQMRTMSGPGGGCAVDGGQGWILVLTTFGLISLRRHRRVS